MGSRILAVIVLVVICVGAYFVYDHYHQEKLMGSGDVSCVGCMTPEESARFAKENSGDTADGQSDTKLRTAAQEDAAGNPQGAVAAGQTAPAAGAAPVVVTAPAPPPAATAPAASETATSTTGVTAPSNLPTGDSVPPNPTNGARFSGSGSYQWYRQGNLTWRVDTVSGRSCIDYATMEEWRKPIVSSHGCGRGA